MSFPELNGPFQSNDLLLRPLVARDAGELYLLIDAHRRSLGLWLPWVERTRGISDMTFYILSLTGFWKSGLTMGIFWGSELAGTVGFQRAEERNSRVEVGYWLAPPFQGKGVAIQAVEMAIEAALGETKVHRIEARVQPDNLRSIRLLERAKFQFEGVERGGIRFSDSFRDHRVYSRLRPTSS